VFGRRVTSFAEFSVPLPEEIDDEYLSENEVGFQPLDSPSVLRAFNVTINIFDIIEDARWIVLPKEHVTLSELTTVLQLNERIDHIQETLPAHLKRSSTAGTGIHGTRNEIFALQSDAVIIRYVDVRDCEMI
jgi:hypothetical protein